MKDMYATSPNVYAGKEKGIPPTQGMRENTRYERLIEAQNKKSREWGMPFNDGDILEFAVSEAALAVSEREKELIEKLKTLSYHEQIGDGDGGGKNGDLVVDWEDILSAIKEP